MDSPLIDVERVGAVAVLTLNRPPANALSMGLLAELRSALDDLARDMPGALVVSGSPKMFAAGADVKEFGGPERAGEVADAFRAGLDALAGFPRLTIAAIEGYALGGGCELALACDFRVVSSKARFGQPEILLGIIPGGGGTQRLARLVGPARAKEIVVTGRQVDAEEALRVGLADRVVEPGSAREHAIAWATELAAGPLVAQALAKRAIDDGVQQSLAAGLDLERQCFVEVFATHDAVTGVASFLENGPGKAVFAGK